jgi:hypothetical protein
MAAFKPVSVSARSIAFLLRAKFKTVTSLLTTIVFEMRSTCANRSSVRDKIDLVSAARTGACKARAKRLFDRRRRLTGMMANIEGLELMVEGIGV